MKVRLSKKYLMMSEVYRIFSEDYKNCLDYSKESLEELFVYESTGKGTVKENNGFAFGKRNVDIAVSSWIEDLRSGYLFIHELYEDDRYPNWFLDKVLSDFSHRLTINYEWDLTNET